MGTIYIIKNTENSKVYYGSTTRPLHIRFKEHKSRANTKSKSYLLYKEMQSIGVDKFSIHALKENVDTQQLFKEEYNAIKSHVPCRDLLNTFKGLTYSDCYEICMLYDQGLTIKQIAEHYKSCKKTISAILKSGGVEIRDWNGEQRSTLTLESVKSLYYDQIKSTTEIGQMYGVSAVTVNKFMKKHGLELRKAIRRDLLSKCPPSQK